MRERFIVSPWRGAWAVNAGADLIHVRHSRELALEAARELAEEAEDSGEQAEVIDITNGERPTD